MHTTMNKQKAAGRCYWQPIAVLWTTTTEVAMTERKCNIYRKLKTLLVLTQQYHHQWSSPLQTVWHIVRNKTTAKRKLTGHSQTAVINHSDFSAVVTSPVPSAASDAWADKDDGCSSDSSASTSNNVKKQPYPVKRKKWAAKEEELVKWLGLYQQQAKQAEEARMQLADKWVSEQFLNGTSAYNRLFSAMKLL